ncbi:DoxX family protein [Dyadobacter luticola]|uniref:DoxX family membrane protein n=1 Tax=Dyadobacter luticola TaxID=1979387 RepID=A0A5R9L381_9BACT|nr:DoxX family protein [Dyadobacter luticola]TLV02871.1 DoxX family membrane protein [Dyadobacter luticola]
MKNKILFVLCLLSGLMFINSGLDKFFHYIPVPKDLPEKMVKVGAAFEVIGWLLPLVGAVEILGGLLLIFPKTRALGAVVLVPVLAGILLTHITMAPAGLPVAIILVAIILWVMIENRKKYLPMIDE